MELQAVLRIATLAGLAVFVVAAVAGHFARSEGVRSVAGWLGLLAVYVLLASILGRLGLAARGAESALDAALPLAAVVSLSVLAIGWHAVSLARSHTVQLRMGWVAACALFLTLGILFAHLVRQTWESESWILLALFGLLLAIFTGGFLVSLVKTLGSYARGRSGGEHATH